MHSQKAWTGHLEASSSESSGEIDVNDCEQGEAEKQEEAGRAGGGKRLTLSVRDTDSTHV